jgi:putative ABC transport system permease protein
VNGLRILATRIRGLFGRGRLDRDLDEEIRAHLDLLVEENIRRGMTPREARDAALRSFGGVVQAKEAYRDQRGLPIVDDLAQDLRYAFRISRKNPGFTALAVVTLALGIGANTAIFTVINGVLLRPLPFKEPERLVAVGTTDERRPSVKEFTSLPDFSDWRTESRTFEGLSAWYTRDFNLTGSEEPLRVRCVFVSAGLLTSLGASPQIGRVFDESEGRADSRVVVLSHGLWQRRFNSDPVCLGQSFTLNDESYTVIGVMRSGFRFPLQGDSGDLWGTFDDVRAEAGPLAYRNGRILEVLGRLKPGATPEQAQIDMDRIGAALRTQYPDTNQRIGVRVTPAVDSLVGDVRSSLLVLFGAVSCVLLIACANVAGLLLARAATRQREMAVRAAIGASRGRIIRQLLTESMLLALGGGTIGGILALWGVDALLSLSPGNLPRIEEVSPDGRVLGFTLIASVVTGLVFGLSPAWHASKTDLTTTLKDGARGSAGGSGRIRGRDTLVAAQIAIAMVLLTGAGLLIHSFWRLRQVDPGFDPENVLTFRLALPDRYDQPEQWRTFYRELQTRLRAVPGVRYASAVLPLPLNGDRVMTGIPQVKFRIEGRPQTGGEQYLGEGCSVQPDYFPAMGIGLISGRAFTQHDDGDAPQVAVINESLALRFFPGEDPIGKRINTGGAWELGPPVWREIVGVVGDVRQAALNVEARPEIYLPFDQDPFPYQWVAVKTEIDPATLVGAVRAQVKAINADMPLFDVKTFDHRYHESVAQQRFNTLLLALFSVIALILTMVGLYGVVSYGVTQRTHEIGIRMALGAQASNVLRLVLKRGLSLVMIGVGTGLAASIVLTRMMSTLLFEVRATDPLTFSVVAIFLMIVALAACYVPARRATGIDPSRALRSE